jgi:hypothetical protein
VLIIFYPEDGETMILVVATKGISELSYNLPGFIYIYIKDFCVELTRRKLYQEHNITLSLSL